MFILVLSGLLNIIYYLPIALRGYFGKPALEKVEKGKFFKSEGSFFDNLPIIILGAAIMLFGVFSTGIINIITQGVAGLF